MQHNFNISQHPTEILHSSVSKYRILIAHHHTFSAFSAAFLKMTGIYNPTHKLSYLIYIYIYPIYYRKYRIQLHVCIWNSVSRYRKGTEDRNFDGITYFNRIETDGYPSGCHLNMSHDKASPPLTNLAWANSTDIYVPIIVL